MEDRYPDRTPNHESCISTCSRNDRSSTLESLLSHFSGVTLVPPRVWTRRPCDGDGLGQDCDFLHIYYSSVRSVHGTGTTNLWKSNGKRLPWKETIKKTMNPLEDLRGRRRSTGNGLVSVGRESSRRAKRVTFIHQVKFVPKPNGVSPEALIGCR